MSSIRIIPLVLLPLLAVACGGYSSPSSPSPAPSPSQAPAPAPAPSGPSLSVSIPRGADVLTTTAFSPDVADITAGTTVTWVNTDSTSHTSTANDAAWNSGTVAPGGRFSHT